MTCMRLSHRRRTSMVFWASRRSVGLQGGGEGEPRLWWASERTRYLSEMTSPCSVNLIRPLTVPAGWATIASCVGPPARHCHRGRGTSEAHAVLAGDVDEVALGVVQPPPGDGDAAELRRVRVAEHHLLPVTPQPHQLTVGRAGEQAVEEVTGDGQRRRGLEQRREADPCHAGVQVDESGLAREDRARRRRRPRSSRRCRTR